MEKRSRIEERGNVRRDTEGGENVRDTRGFITQPEIKTVSSQTVWQTKPGRRLEINRQPVLRRSAGCFFFVRKDYCGPRETRPKYSLWAQKALNSRLSAFWIVRNLERLLATLRQDARLPTGGPPLSSVRRPRSEVLRANGRMMSPGTSATNHPDALFGGGQSRRLKTFF